MDAISGAGFSALALAKLGTSMQQQEVQAEAAVKVMRKNRDVQADAALSLIETIPDVGRLVDVKA